MDEGYPKQAPFTNHDTTFENYSLFATTPRSNSRIGHGHVARFLAQGCIPRMLYLRFRDFQCSLEMDYSEIKALLDIDRGVQE